MQDTISFCQEFIIIPQHSTLHHQAFFLVTSIIFSQDPFSRRPSPFHGHSLHRGGLNCFTEPFCIGSYEHSASWSFSLVQHIITTNHLFTLLHRCHCAGGATTELVQIQPLGTPPLLIAQTQPLENFTSRLTQSVMRFNIASPGNTTNSIGYYRLSIKTWMGISNSSATIVENRTSFSDRRYLTPLFNSSSSSFGCWDNTGRGPWTIHEAAC